MSELAKIGQLASDKLKILPLEFNLPVPLDIMEDRWLKQSINVNFTGTRYLCNLLL